MPLQRERLAIPASTGRVHSLLAALPPDADLVCVRANRGNSRGSGHGKDTYIIGVAPDEVISARGPQVFTTLDGLSPGWWAGFVSYEAGHTVEKVRPRGTDRRQVSDFAEQIPGAAFGRFDARLIVSDDGSEPRVEGDGSGRELLESALRSPAAPLSPVHQRPNAQTWTSSLTRPEFEEAVESIRQLIAEGECFQVNLTRRLSSWTRADSLSLFAAIWRANVAPQSALVRLGNIQIVSASPEQFLRRDGRRVSTRPIKGTASTADNLASSKKDRAENVMIVDLARNDLGRVCEYRSVRVDELCAVEKHPGLFHLVSTVSGVLRPDIRPGTLLAATFPPASITGAPKPRVMQIIEDLEPVRRGVYCGAIGWIDTVSNTMDLSVAIRTFTLIQDEIHFGVGGGIVIDSDATAEWEETKLKARNLLQVAGTI